MIDDKDVIELNSFTLNSPKALVIDVGVPATTNDQTPLEILPGKYRVFKKIDPDCNDMKMADLFIFHESMIDKNISLDDYSWKKGGYFDANSDDLDAVACIFDKDEYTKKFNKDFTNKCVDQLDDKIVEVFENGVVFSFIQPDNSYQYAIIVENEKIIGFQVDGVGTVTKTLDTRFSNACRRGNFERVKSMLSTKDENEVNIRWHNYDGFDWACRNGQADIVKYLVTSTDLKENISIDVNNGYFFEKLCFQYPEIIESLVFESNLQKTPIIEGILDRSKHTQEMKLVKNFFNIRELNEKLTFELNTEELTKKSSIKMKV